MDIILRQKISLLINLARADGHFAEEEKELIFNIALSNGLTEQEVNELIEIPDNIQSPGALSRERKKEYLLDSIRLMMADGQIKESELRFCRNLAVKLTYHQDVVDHLVKKWSKKISSIDLREFQLPSF